jgi:hypothetical protein
VDQLAQEPGGPAAVMHVARPVLQPQDVAGLGQVREQGVVAGVLLEMGIVAAEGPAHGVPRSDDGPIDVDRQPRQVEPLQLLVEQRAIEGDQRLERLLSELLEPVDHGTVRRNPRQARESRHQRIVGEIAQVFEAAGADREQRDHQQHQSACAVVAAEPVAVERLLDPPMQPEQPAVPAQEFQAAVRGQLLRDKLDGQIGLDDASQPRYRQPHQKGLRCVRDDVGTSSLKSASEALLIHPDDSFTGGLSSDRG